MQKNIFSRNKLHKVKGRLFFILSILSLVLLLSSTSCTNNEPYSIGIIGTMTGANSDLSVSGRRGAEIAIDEINQQGGIHGRQLKLVVKDDENNPAIALLRDQEFIDEGIQVVIGHYTSSMVTDLMEFINTQPLLLISPTISSDYFSGKDDHLIRFIASTKEQGIVLANQAAANKHHKFLVLYDEKNIGYTQALLSQFDDVYSDKTGIEPLVYPYNKEYPEKIMEAYKAVEEEGIDGVLIIGSAEDSALIATEVKKIHPTIQLYGTLWANTDELIHKGGTHIEGMYITGIIDFEHKTEKMATFEQTFVKRFGESPTFSSMISYETVMALAVALRNTKELDAKLIKQEILDLSTFEGLFEDIVIDQYGDNSRKYVMFVIEEGKFKGIK